MHDSDILMNYVRLFCGHTIHRMSVRGKQRTSIL